MNTTSRTLLQTILATDASLSVPERTAAQKLLDGQIEMPTFASVGSDERLLVTQKRAAELLSVSRSTIWRMTKELILHPVEILPGTLRYPFTEVARLARGGTGAAGPPGESLPTEIVSAA